MTLRRLLRRNLFGHWRGNLAVLLGVAVGTAVLTGALLVGDSLRGSLRDLTLRQLGWVDHVLISQHFIRQELVDRLQAEHACPAILFQGSANRISADAVDKTDLKSVPQVHVGRVSILGVTEQFWLEGQAPLGRDFWHPAEPENLDEPQVVLNQELARQLKADEGAQIILNFPKMTAIPRETLLGQRDAQQVLGSLSVKVAAILPDQASGGQFSLQPTSVTPRNVYIPLSALQAKLDQEAKQDGINISLKDRVNVLLAQADKPYALSPYGMLFAARARAMIAQDSIARLNRNLASHLTLDDWGLVLHNPQSRTDDLFRRLSPRAQTDRLTERQWKGRVARRFAEEADSRGVLSAFVSAFDMTPLAASRIAIQQPVLTRQNVKAYFERRGYLSLESRQLLLDSETVRAALSAAAQTHIRAAPTLIYLADSLTNGKQKTSYALVAALDPTLPWPLGPFLPPGVNNLTNQDIVLAQAAGPILPGRIGDPINLAYYDPENENELRTAEFRLAGFLPLQGAAADPFLIPEFPGITDRTSIDQWNPPPQIHFDNRRVKRPDDEWFWDEFRTTPKAFVTLHRGEQLWGKSRFGKYTSIRLAPARSPRRPSGPEANESERDLIKTAEEYRQALLQQLRPENAGLVFDPVAERRLAASSGGQDFGMLFVGFSVFLIVAALLLVGLLFRLNLDLRANEIGILFASGFSKRAVRRLLFLEGNVLVAAGGIIGLVGAVIYAALLLRLLRAWWPGGLEQSFLTLHLGESNGLSFVIGYLASFVVSVLTIAWAMRVLARIPPRQLLAGQTGDDLEMGAMFSRPINVSIPHGNSGWPRKHATRRSWSWWIAGSATVVALALAISAPWAPQGEMQAMTFFTSGMLLLIAVLAATWALLRGQGTMRFFRPPASSPPRTLATSPRLRILMLAARNSSRHPVRSLLTTGLVASATFLLVAVQSFHRQPEKGFLDKDSGSGGFALFAETDVPLFEDLNNEKVRHDQLNLSASAAQTLQGATFYPFRLRAGDDASCLNLYQARRPRLLGAPPAFIRRGGFRFASSEAQTAEQRRNPWLLLDQPIQEHIVPVIADATTAEWVLHKKLGEVLEIPDERGRPNERGENVVRLRIVALLQDSVFQSELLLSEANFLELYPRQEGYNFYLIETPVDRIGAVRDLLQATLASRGVEVTETIDRVRSYMAVENTYLLTFQALGGLGLLLGALGLAVVLMRSVWERRGELALLRALGYRKQTLGWLVLAENGLLLVLGLAGGTLAALLAVAPHLAGAGGRLPWLEISGLLAAVLIVGLVAETAAVAATLRAPLLAALRRE